MSQYVKVQCNVLDDVNPALFLKMIEKLKVKSAPGQYGLNTELKRTRYSGKDDVDCVLTCNGRILPIGFKFTKELDSKTHRMKTKMAIRGDFWNTGLDEVDFPNQIRQTYQVTHLTQVAYKGRVTMQPKVRPDGKIVLRVAG